MNLGFSFSNTSRSLITNNALGVNLYVFFGSAGYSLYLAWLVTLFCSPIIHSEVFFGSAITPYAGFALFAAMIVVLLIAWSIADALSTAKGLLCLAAVVFVASPLACIGLLLPSISASVQIALWAVSALGGISLLLLWSNFLSSLEHKTIMFSTTASFGMAAFIFIVVSYMQPVPALVATIIMPMASAVMFLCIRSSVSERVPVVSAKESDRRSLITWKSFAAACANCICLGFAFYCTSLVPMWPYGVLILGVVVIAACIGMAIDGCGKERFTEDVQLKLFLPCATVGILPMAFLGPTGKLACVAFLLLAFVPQAITNINAISENVHICELQPIRIFSLGRIGNATGALIGFAVGYLAFNSDIKGQLTAMAVSLGILFIFIIIATFVLEGHYPVEEADDLADLPSMEGTIVPPGESFAMEQGKGLWKLRCEIFAQNYGLSPRQAEVLFLLAKGRNASYIQEKLVVSNHTVKAHIYNIYQKAEVHSRQELINLIEKIDLDAKSKNL
ncbi:MAG: helix-turn-helix transcriptional regulator [Actinobacteria bacterium]|nr:helix-turn-helix transcriptional regulator [Actinomycetota bacterium]